ncbi:VOC family protein [Aliiroseovarius crassostreae]|uniref:VOC family protein n=1 Tax=Aliiroseovarius crassostreae TaxID=154981 RepID=A0A9Q9HBG4_9RHOB|nr:VOC family protein [Aliiroseovarius crassostreae]UWP91637.1 VOC family protein [Aliiroseovarius crassostreae]UWP94781.1 VOC family protein [Aliiroseovarius crassostreae]UWP97944.1 VOC family protein [Aliiroseovarius crassostreae]UWQ01127.1 VOC family protein [Aliiroseovarius crassostreae]
MQLGTFSLSLAVKDITASLAFYQALGFRQIGGDMDQNWVILESGGTVIGLFQGMFEKNMMTFNPGWAAPGVSAEEFDDIRKIQAMLQEVGITPTRPAAPGADGPDHLLITDPDGNTIMLDQHVPKPT